LSTLTDRLFALGKPYLERHASHPTVRALTNGTLDDATARAWLEQDYLYLVDEIRVLTRLAWQAPLRHQEDLVDLAWNVIHEEIPHHRTMSERFGATPDAARKGPACLAYSTWILDTAADYGLGLVALLSGLWAYSSLGPRLALPSEPRLREWVASYQSPEFAELATRYAQMVDETRIDPARAEETFRQGLRHGIDFWDVSDSNGPAQPSEGPR
jgi:thiaminase/transcriptional activator TenA